MIHRLGGKLVFRGCVGFCFWIKPSLVTSLKMEHAIYYYKEFGFFGPTVSFSTNCTTESLN